MTGVGYISSSTELSENSGGGPSSGGYSSSKSSSTHLPIVTLEPQIIIQPPEMSTFHSLFMGSKLIRSTTNTSSSSTSVTTISIKAVDENSPTYRTRSFNDMEEEEESSATPGSSPEYTTPVQGTVSPMVSLKDLYSSDHHTFTSSSKSIRDSRRIINETNTSSSAKDFSISAQSRHWNNEMTDLDETTSSNHNCRRSSTASLDDRDEQRNRYYHRQQQQDMDLFENDSFYEVKSSSSPPISKQQLKDGSVGIDRKKVTKTQRQRNDRDKRYNHGRWTTEEHELFVKAYQICGRDWSRIAREFVRTRMRSQVASHAQKYLMKLEGNTSAFGQDEGSSTDSSEDM